MCVKIAGRKYIVMISQSVDKERVIETELYLTTKQRNKIKRALKALEEVRKEMDLQTELAVNWYLEDSNNLNLLEGDSHSGIEGSANRGMVIELFNLPQSGGGGW